MSHILSNGIIADTNGNLIECVPTEEFWGRMCDDRFVRIGPLSGRIGEWTIVTLNAPEHIPGFMANQAKKILDLLGVPNERPVR